MVYLYRNPETGEVKEVTQKMSEVHVYSEDGVLWDRIFLAPKIAIDTKINPFSQRDFTEKTGRKRGTVGDLWDKSAELSEKRKQVAGRDEVKEKAYKDYSEKRGGLKHIKQVKEERGL